jgi:hypothetical protein
MNMPTKQWYQRQEEKLTISSKVQDAFGCREELQARGVKLAVVQVRGCGPELALYVNGHVFAVALTEFKGFTGQRPVLSRTDRVSVPTAITAPPEVYQSITALSGDVRLTRPSRLYASGYLVCRSTGDEEEGESTTYGAKIVVSRLVTGGSPVTVSVGAEHTREMFGGDNEGPLIVEHETEELSTGTYRVNVWHARTAGTKTATLVSGELASQSRYGQEGGVWTVNETIAKPKGRRLW